MRKRIPPLKQRVDPNVFIMDVIRDVNAEELGGLDTNEEALGPTVFFLLIFVLHIILLLFFRETKK